MLLGCQETNNSLSLYLSLQDYTSIKDVYQKRKVCFIFLIANGTVQLGFLQQVQHHWPLWAEKGPLYFPHSKMPCTTWLFHVMCTTLSSSLFVSFTVCMLPGCYTAKKTQFFLSLSLCTQQTQHHWPLWAEKGLLHFPHSQWRCTTWLSPQMCTTPGTCSLQHTAPQCIYSKILSGSQDIYMGSTPLFVFNCHTICWHNFGRILPTPIDSLLSALCAGSPCSIDQPVHTVGVQALHVLNFTVPLCPCQTPNKDHNGKVSPCLCHLTLL